MQGPLEGVSVWVAHGDLAVYFTVHECAFDAGLVRVSDCSLSVVDIAPEFSDICHPPRGFLDAMTAEIVVFKLSLIDVSICEVVGALSIHQTSFHFSNVTSAVWHGFVKHLLRRHQKLKLQTNKQRNSTMLFFIVTSCVIATTIHFFIGHKIVGLTGGIATGELAVHA